MGSRDFAAPTPREVEPPFLEFRGCAVVDATVDVSSFCDSAASGRGQASPLSGERGLSAFRRRLEAETTLSEPREVARLVPS